MAYTVPVTRPSCVVCGNYATVQLFNNRNAPLGYYCGRHGQLQLATQDWAEAKQ